MTDLSTLEKELMRRDLPAFRPGDVVRVTTKFMEGDKEKTTPFQGTVIQVRGAGINRSFTVRKMSRGIGIERIFQLHSPLLVKIEVKKHGRVRRARLYYLRGRTGRESKLREKSAGKRTKARVVEEEE